MVHAMLANAAAVAVGGSIIDSETWAKAAGTPLR
jgi:hypothetical protein